MAAHDDVEKVARAICEAFPMAWDAILEDQRAHIRSLAAAAIAAMGEVWRDIASAPRDGTRVLLWMEPVNDARFVPTDGPHQVIGTWVVWSDAMKREGMKEGWSWYGSPLHYATKWKHLPPPPGAKP